MVSFFTTMKVLSYKRHAERIAWERKKTLDALCDEILTAIYWKLSRFKPNTALNIRHPWKLRDRRSLRGWCPRHDGMWVKLVVRADDDGHVTFECTAGCSEEQVREHIGDLDDVVHRPPSADSAMGAGAHRQDRRWSTSNVLDARHRFSRQRSLSPGDRPAA